MHVNMYACMYACVHTVYGWCACRTLKSCTNIRSGATGIRVYSRYQDYHEVFIRGLCPEHMTIISGLGFRVSVGLCSCLLRLRACPRKCLMPHQRTENPNPKLKNESGISGPFAIYDVMACARDQDTYYQRLVFSTKCSRSFPVPGEIHWCVTLNPKPQANVRVHTHIVRSSLQFLLPRHRRRLRQSSSSSSLSSSLWLLFGC